jgi:hypothetical protein
LVAVLVLVVSCLQLQLQAASDFCLVQPGRNNMVAADATLPFTIPLKLNQHPKLLNHSNLWPAWPLPLFFVE